MNYNYRRFITTATSSSAPQRQRASSPVNNCQKLDSLHRLHFCRWQHGSSSYEFDAVCLRKLPFSVK